MSCSNNTFITFHAADNSDFAMPVVMETEGHTREATVFYLGTKAGHLSIAGTFDEITQFASAIVSAMYSWPIVTGHDEWLGQPVEVNSEGADVYVIRNASTIGRDGNRRSGAEGDRDAGDVA